MAKGDRTGNRKTREQRRTIKVPELGYYLIVTDTEGTERCFFAGLHQSLSEEVRNKLVIKVVETKTRSMIDKCLELTVYEAQYRIPWIVFDRDQVIGFDEIISEAEKNQKKNRMQDNITACTPSYHAKALVGGALAALSVNIRVRGL